MLEQVVGRVAQGGSWAHAELLGDEVRSVVECLVDGGRARYRADGGCPLSSTERGAARSSGTAGSLP